ncbi:TylF/MycF family methyltransferase [bacterium]|nr:TylF/MycF family methyltransferase [bacterium]
MSDIPSKQVQTADSFKAERKQQRDRWVDFKSSMAKFRDGILPSEFGKLYHKVLPYSMMSYARLKGIHSGACDVISGGVAGDFVECGTARGGGAALMGLTCRQQGETRNLWIFDTYEGLPEPTADDPDYELAKKLVGKCRGEYDEVRGLLERLEILGGVQMVKGLFQDTVPVSDVGAIALLHLDGDWYDSTMVCLEHLYDKVTPGGVIQIDDYGHWAGARKALHEFLDARGIEVELKYLDYTGRQFIKPK